eukprot:439785_1
MRSILALVRCDILWFPIDNIHVQVVVSMIPYHEHNIVSLKPLEWVQQCTIDPTISSSFFLPYFGVHFIGCFVYCIGTFTTYSSGDCGSILLVFSDQISLYCMRYFTSMYDQ